MKYPLIIIGDVNINLLQKKDTSVKKYLYLLNSYHIQSFNSTIPTRITNHSSTLIDHSLSNLIALPFIHDLMVSPTGSTDHSLTIFRYKKSAKKVIPFQIYQSFHIHFLQLIVPISYVR